MRGATLSMGVKPEGREFDAPVEKLLRGGYIAAYSSPTAHGSYRLTGSGIDAADGVDNRASPRKVSKGPGQTNG